AFATFYFGMKWPERALSLTLAGIGSGAIRGEDREKFQRDAEEVARRLIVEGWDKLAEVRCTARTRVQLQNKSPRAFASFVEQIKRHSGKGSAMTLTGYQAQRPSLEEFKADMAKCRVPTLIICGDEDEPCMDASVMVKRHMPSAGLVFMPQTGHACNIEEPELFNLLCEKFFHQVESGQYRMRDPRAVPNG
ncbi:MAG TPA: alpha/beta hydrolase, partial [Burkholderiales bacterium]|nr:alpha/beta hydrolase [Burkholderiales bacterium]